MTLNTANFSNSTLDTSHSLKILTAAGLNMFAKEFPMLIEKERTDLEINKQMRYEGAGALSERQEGAGAAESALKEGYVDTTQIKDFAFDMPVTRKMLKFFIQGNTKLMGLIGNYQSRSALLRFEYTGVSPLDNGFSSTEPFASGDGAAYFSASHTFKHGGTYSNLLTAGDLSKTQLESALKSMANAKMENNIPAALIVKRVVIGYENVFVFPELTKSNLDPESGNNTYNVFQDFGLGKVFTHYAADTDQWTLDSSQPSRTLYEADPIKLGDYKDPKTRTHFETIEVMIQSGHHDQLRSFSNAGI